MLNNIEDIKHWLYLYEIKFYYINEDLTVDVNYNIDLSSKKLSKIPIKFNKINGDFYCHNNTLTSLEFCPEKVAGDLNISNNKIKSLKHSPKIIEGYFDCALNNLTSLEFCPEKISGDFDCSINKLVSLQYIPKKIYGDFYCTENKLIDLKYFPKDVLGNVNIEYNNIKKESLSFFDSNIKGNIYSDFGMKHMFLNIVQEQKLLQEKEKLANTLTNNYNENSQLTKKRL